MTLIHNHINIHQVLGDGLKYNFSHMFALNIMFQEQQKGHTTINGNFKC